MGSYQDLLIELENLGPLPSLRQPPETAYTTTVWKNLRSYTVQKQSETNIRSLLTQLATNFVNDGSPTAIMRLACVLASQVRIPGSDDLIINSTSVADFCTVVEEVLGAADIGVENANQQVEPLFKRKNFTVGNAEVYSRMTDEANTGVVIWGPLIGALILRCEKRDSRSVARKMVGLSKNIAKWYPNSKCLCPTFNVEHIEPLLKRLYKYVPWRMGRDTVYLGYINAYHNEDASNFTKNVLDYICLQSLRYTGMMLITLVDQVSKAYHCTYEDLMDGTALGGTLSSWRNYKDFVDNFLDPENCPDSVWPYIREFNATILSKFSYPRNDYLCNLMALLLDYMGGGNDESVYKRISSIRQNVPKATAFDKNYAKVLSESLKERHNMS